MAVQPAAQEEVPSNDAVLDAASLSDTEYLAKLGYKQELKRDLGLFSAFGVQFSSIAVTSSMYTTLVVGLLFFGPASFWSWVIGGTLQVFPSASRSPNWSRRTRSPAASTRSTTAYSARPSHASCATSVTR